MTSYPNRHQPFNRYVYLLCTTSKWGILFVLVACYSLLPFFMTKDAIVDAYAAHTTGNNIVINLMQSVSAMWIHVSIEHLLMNLFLFVMVLFASIFVTKDVEFIIVFILSGVISSFGYTLFGEEPNRLIGASGAIYGIAGYVYIKQVKRLFQYLRVRKYRKQRHKTPLATSVARMLFVPILMSIFIVGFFYDTLTIDTNVSVLAHAIGFLFGVLAALIYLFNRTYRNL